MNNGLSMPSTLRAWARVLRSSRISRAFVLGTIVLCGTARSAAAAPTQARQCVASNDAAVTLREAGKLLEAREKFAECAVPACPALIFNACEKHVQDLNAAIPTITFDVKDGLGHDLTSVDVAVDERPSVKLSGSPLVLNPGAHRFKFAAEGQPSVSLSFVLHEGDKGRRERVTIGAPPVEKPAALPTPVVSLPPVREEPPKVTRQHGKTQMILGLASGAVGLVGLGVGTTFGLKSFSAKSNQIVTCTVASCDASQHSQALTDRSNVNTYSTISTAAFGVGGVFLVGGVVMLLTTPRSQEVRAPSAVVVVPSVGSGGGGLLVQGEF